MMLSCLPLVHHWASALRSKAALSQGEGWNKPLLQLPQGVELLSVCGETTQLTRSPCSSAMSVMHSSLTGRTVLTELACDHSPFVGMISHPLNKM